MRSGQTARQAGVDVQYYERRGLLRPPARRESGYPEYPSDAVRTVRFVKRAQELGFTLTEVLGRQFGRRAVAPELSMA